MAAGKGNVPLLAQDSDSEEEDEEIAIGAAAALRPTAMDEQADEEDEFGDDDGGGAARAGGRRQTLVLGATGGGSLMTARAGAGGVAGVEEELAGAFTEAQLNSASDRFREAWARVQADPWDVRSWQAVLSEAQTQRSGRSITLREVYRLALKQFPTAVKLWREWLEHELRLGHLTEADALFRRCLLEVPHVDLFLLYLQRIRRANPAALGDGTPEEVEKQRGEVTAAFELAARQVGVAVNATQLWLEYINYVKAWREAEGQTAEQATKIQALRRVFHRAVLVPVDNLDELWRQYETWERTVNEHGARTMLPTLQPGFNQARQIARERRGILDNQKLDKLAVPPTRTLEEREQLHLLRKRVDYEKSNPENVDPVALKDRVRLAYRQSLAYFYRFPEVWHEFARYEAETDDAEAAAALYARGVAAVPDCLLLHLAYAEHEESRGQAEHGVEILRQFLEREPSTLGYIAYQQLVRRTQGKEAARKVFSATKALRRKGTLSYHMYLAHARVELHLNHEPEVARRVLDYGLAQHPDFLAEPEYVLALLDILLQLHDDQNYRGLCDRALAVLEGQGKAEEARPIWQRLLQFEVAFAGERDAARVERVQQRIAAMYPKEEPPHSLLRVWRRLDVFHTFPPPDSTDDLLRQRWDEDRYSFFQVTGGAAGAGRPGTATARSRTPQPAAGEGDGGAENGGAGAAPTAGQEGEGGDGRVRQRRDDAPKSVHAKRLQAIPDYARRLYQVLPISSGPPPDIDTIIRSLRDNPLPPRPPGGPPPQVYGRGGAGGDPRGGGGERRGRKRGRWGGGGDSESDDDDENERGPMGPAGDVFRARQQERMMKELQR